MTLSKVSAPFHALANPNNRRGGKSSTAEGFTPKRLQGGSSKHQSFGGWVKISRLPLHAGLKGHPVASLELARHYRADGVIGVRVNDRLADMISACIPRSLAATRNRFGDGAVVPATHRTKNLTGFADYQWVSFEICNKRVTSGHK